MASPPRPYSRVYWQIVEDTRFESIFHDDHHLAAWLRLLLVADAAWPASAQVPSGVRPASLRALVACGLIETARRNVFRVHGLDSERGARAASARVGAERRWASERTADALPTQSNGNANGMLAKTSLDELRQDELPRAQGAPSKHEADVAREVRGRAVDAFRWTGQWDEPRLGPEPEWNPTWGEKPKNRLAAQPTVRA